MLKQPCTEVVENKKLPDNFSRDKKGIIYTDKTGKIIEVFPYDLYPVSLAQDESLKQEIMTLKVCDPHSGWFEVKFRTALLHDAKALLMTLADQGVHPHYGKEEKALFMSLLSSYMQSLKDRREKVVLSKQMGWLTKPDGTEMFVLGDRIINKSGIQTIGVARTADQIINSIKKIGHLKPWVEATSLLNNQGLEPWAFTLAALGFGAPLIKFTGYKGAMLSMVGDSGLGKTAMGWFALSMWGDPNKLQMVQRDTLNATVARMAFYNNLPLFVDEVTNIDAKSLSDMAYLITQGRDKYTLDQKRSEREAMTWETIGAASSNKSLIDIMGGYKSNASAEINRIFEYDFPKGMDFQGTKIYHAITKNYGHAGEVYAKYLVDHQTEHFEMLMNFQTSIEQAVDAKPEERFWVIVAACALYGGWIAQSIGLFNVDLLRLREWVYTAISNMRKAKKEIVVNSAEWIANFLGKYSGNMLVVRPNIQGKFQVILKPKGPLELRKDDALQMVWINKELVRRELLNNSINYNQIRSELISQHILLGDNKRFVLGKGTNYEGMSQICWEISLKAPVLKHLNPPQILHYGGNANGNASSIQS